LYILDIKNAACGFLKEITGCFFILNQEWARIYVLDRMNGIYRIIITMKLMKCMKKNNIKNFMVFLFFMVKMSVHSLF